MGTIDEAGAGGSSCECERIASGRFWSSDEKRRMVAESFAPGASASKVAQRYGVNANLLFTWRRRDARSAATGGVEAVELLPVRVERT
jgi:transposase